MPDTTPQRLEEIRAVAALVRSPEWSPWVRGAVTDLLAMIDALEGQIRDLTRPEEDVKPDPYCTRCFGTGSIIMTNMANVFKAPCPNCIL